MRREFADDLKIALGTTCPRRIEKMKTLGPLTLNDREGKEDFGLKITPSQQPEQTRLKTLLCSLQDFKKCPTRLFNFH